MYKRILTIQDISCVGQCSLTVALPILSACGLETAILPSAVLSNHTAEAFGGFTFRDLTDDIPSIASHWERIGVRFDAFYTGYLGSARQIDYVKSIMERLANPGALRIVDPAMADNGRLYTGFDSSFVDSMRRLCSAADIILPNVTEAALLTGNEYREDYDEAYIHHLLEALCEHSQTVVMTGVSFTPGKTGVMILENGKTDYYEHDKIFKGCHGTGDVYASAFTGALMHGRPTVDAAKIAADFTVECIRRTIDDPGHWYGVKFELALPSLLRMLER